MILEGHVLGQESTHPLDLTIGNRRGFASRSDKPYHAMSAHHLQALGGTIDDAGKGVPRKKRQRNLFLPVAPTMDPADQGQEGFDFQIPQLGGDNFLVARPSANRIPMRVDSIPPLWRFRLVIHSDAPFIASPSESHKVTLRVCLRLPDEHSLAHSP